MFKQLREKINEKVTDSSSSRRSRNSSVSSLRSDRSNIPPSHTPTPPPPSSSALPLLPTNQSPPTNSHSNNETPTKKKRNKRKTNHIKQTQTEEIKTTLNVEDKEVQMTNQLIALEKENQQLRKEKEDEPTSLLTIIQESSPRPSIEDGYGYVVTNSNHQSENVVNLSSNEQNLENYEKEIIFCQEKLSNLELSIQQLQMEYEKREFLLKTKQNDWMEANYQELRELQTHCHDLEEQLIENQTIHQSLFQQREQELVNHIAAMQRDHESIQYNWHQQRQDLEESLISLEQQLQVINVQNISIATENTQLEKLLHQKSTQFHELRQEIDSQNKQFQLELQQGQDNYEHLRNNKEIEITNLKTNFQQNQQRCQELEKECNELKQQTSRDHRNLLIIENNLKQLTNDNHTHLATIDQLTNENQQLNQLTRQLRDKLNDCESELLEVTRQNLEAHRQLQENMHFYTTQMNNNEEEEEEEQQLDGEKKNNESTTSTARSSKKAPTTSQLLRLQEVELLLKSRECANEELDKQLMNYQEQFHTMNQLQNKLTSEVEREKEKKLQLEDELTRAKKLIQQMELEQKNEINRVVEEYRNQLDDHIDEHNQKIKNLMKEFQLKISNKEEEFQETFEDALRRQREEEGRLREEKEDELRNMESWLNEKEEERQDLERQLIACQTNEKNINEQNKQLNLQLLQLNDEIQSLKLALNEEQKQTKELLLIQNELLSQTAATNALDDQQLLTNAGNLNESSSSLFIHQETVPLHEHEVLQMHAADLEGQVAQLNLELISLKNTTALQSQQATTITTSAKSPLSIKEPRETRSSIGSTSSRFSLCITDVPEYEYFKNVLIEYMIGRERRTLSKVICSIMKFSPQEIRNVSKHENQSESWL